MGLQINQKKSKLMRIEVEVSGRRFEIVTQKENRIWWSGNEGICVFKGTVNPEMWRTKSTLKYCYPPYCIIAQLLL